MDHHSQAVCRHLREGDVIITCTVAGRVPAKKAQGFLRGARSTSARITLHGFPAATTFAGISPVTTLLAPITELFPILAPFRTRLPTPNQTLSPISIGRGSPLRGSSGCQSPSVISVFAPHLTWLPIVIPAKAPITVPLNPVCSPIRTTVPGL